MSIITVFHVIKKLSMDLKLLKSKLNFQMRTTISKMKITSDAINGRLNKEEGKIGETDMAIETIQN